MEKYPQLVEKLRDLYEPVKCIMEKIAYGKLITFINETIVRAITNLALKDLSYKSSQKDIASYLEKCIKDEEKIGFYLIRFTIEQLEYYKENRDKYKSFDQFVPYLLKKYYEEKDSLIESHQEYFKAMSLIGCIFDLQSVLNVFHLMGIVFREIDYDDLNNLEKWKLASEKLLSAYEFAGNQSYQSAISALEEAVNICPHVLFQKYLSAVRLMYLAKKDLNLDALNEASKILKEIGDYGFLEYIPQLEKYIREEIKKKRP